MNQAERIKKLMRKVFREGSGPAVSPMGDRILSDASTTMKQAVAANQSGRRVVLWRTIMKSPYTRTAAVVAIGLAVLSFLFPKHGIVPESVALADVQRAVQAQETVFATGTRTIIFAEKPTFVPPGMAGLFDKPANENGSFALEFNAESYLSPKGYATKIYAQDGKLVMQASVHNETGKAIVLLPTAKAYVRFDVVEAYRQRMAAFTIQGFIDMIYKSGDCRKVGPKRVHGVEAVGFEAGPWDERALQGINPYFVKLLFNLQNGTGRVWIDPETKLPVQTEGEIELRACVLSFFKDAEARQVDNDFQWNIEIDEAVFLPEVPGDFQELSLPGGAAVGIAASAVAVAGILPWCVFFVRYSRRRMRSTN